MNDYDQTKYLLDKIRDFKPKPKPKPINEHEETMSVDNQMDQQETTTLSDSEMEDEIKQFKEAVGGVASFNDFLVMEGNIKWSGKLDSDNIEWSFVLDKNDGCIIKTDGAVLSDEVVERIIKLKSYFTVWSDYWTKEVNG